MIDLSQSVPSSPETAPAWTPASLDRLQELAAAAGFDRVGVASVEDHPHEARDAQRFTDWVDTGRAGEMEYLKRRDKAGDLLRGSTQTAFPWACSVVVCAINYNADAPLSIDPASDDAGWIARYAWSGKPSSDDTPSGLLPTDYHEDLLARLKLLESELRQIPGCETRPYVDTGPLVERTLAARAGVGWIGKNTCVLNQELGSWLLLGVIATSLRLAEPDRFDLAQDRCGSCTRCIDACPTAALIAPRQMDASRCIAYLTIEKRGSIPEHLRALMGRQVFGCDICQEVCPWNRRAPVAQKPGLTPRHELVNPALDWLASLDAPEFHRFFKGSPLERTRQSRLHRNVAIAMGNSGDARYLPQLETWMRGDDPVLAEAAAWAFGRINGTLPEPKAESAESPA